MGNVRDLDLNQHPPPTTEMCCPHSFTLYRPGQGGQNARFWQKRRFLQKCAIKSKMCLKLTFKLRRAGVYDKRMEHAQFCWHNSVDKKSYTAGGR